MKYQVKCNIANDKHRQTETIYIIKRKTITRNTRTRIKYKLTKNAKKCNITTKRNITNYKPDIFKPQNITNYKPDIFKP